MDGRSDGSIPEPVTPTGSPIRIPLLPKRTHKFFNDPIHDHIPLRPISCAVIDTIPLQRLRRLKQLGFSDYVFSGASHTRFAHSLGVGYLAGLWAETLLEGYPHEEKARFCTLVELAGLCHDLGHGPYSHSWEHRVLPALGNVDWHHEEMSVKLVEHIFQASDFEEYFGITRSDCKLIQSLILGSKPSGGQTHCGDLPVFLFDIVNNKNNGFDVDKFDYLRRDSLYTKVAISAPYPRLLNFAKVIGNSIGYRLSEQGNLRKVFADRVILHRDVYTHRVTRCIDLMIGDSMKEVGRELRLPEISHSPIEFLKLNDSLTDYIKHWYPSNSPGAEKARHILHRIDTRDLYTACGEIKVPDELISALKGRIKEEDIVACQSGNGMVDLRPDDIHVDEVYIDCGLKERDPIGETMFYTERPSEHGLVEDVVATCQWMWVRVYCKDKKHERATKEAFESWRCRQFGSQSIQTPTKQESRYPNDQEMED